MTQVTAPAAPAAPAPTTVEPITVLTPPAAPTTKPAVDEGKPAGTEQNTNEPANKDDPSATVPEKYEFDAPEGMELDGVAVGEFSELAKELKLPQAEAKRVVDVAIKMAQRRAEDTAKTVKGWADQCKADKEFGGDNLDANVAVAQKAIDTFGTPELKAILSQSGWGNHPEFVRFAYKAGKAISDDTFVKGGNPASSNDKPMANRMYPDLK